MDHSRYPVATGREMAGFTLIELVMVIVILGILAVIAMPRFVDLGKDARVATLKGLEGALQSAWTMAHAQQLAQGKLADDAITVEGNAIAMSNGYPTAAAMAAMLDITGFDSATPGTFKVKDGDTPRSDCQVMYNPATASGTPPVITKPTLTRTDSGC